MREKINATAIQMDIAINDIDKNLSTIEQMMKKVFKEFDSDIVVFPEDCVTGPIPDSPDLALGIESEPMRFFSSLALKYKTYIVTGSFVQKSGGKFYNTSLLINKNGEVILEYRKMNLWHSERSYLSPGSELKSVDTEIGRVGIMICWDVANPLISRELTRQGADVICCPSFWTRDRTDMLEKYMSGNEEYFVNTICPARALENEVLFIFSNASGISKYYQNKTEVSAQLIGQSQICAPIVGCVAKVNNDKPGFAAYSYDKKMAEDAEKILKLKTDLKS